MTGIKGCSVTATAGALATFGVSDAEEGAGSVWHTAETPLNNKQTATPLTIANPFFMRNPFRCSSKTTRPVRYRHNVRGKNGVFSQKQRPYSLGGILCYTLS
jgi:hypothetical protein